MPRPRNPAKEAHRAEQERYRKRLKEARKPEAPQVDGALAAAFAVVLGRFRSAEKSDPVLETVIEASKAILIEAGFAPNEAVRKLMGRLLFRDDLDSLNVITKKPPKGEASPHYFRFGKRHSQVSLSEENRGDGA